MQIKKMLQEDDAVSPVIGVILMVAITVILAAVIASFVLGLGGSQQSTPQASFSWDFTEYDQGSSGDTVYGVAEISHDGGDAIKASELYIRGDGLMSSPGSKSNFKDSDGDKPEYDFSDSTQNWDGANADGDSSVADASGSVGGSSAVVGGNSGLAAVNSDFELSLVWEPEEGDTSATLSEQTGPDA